MAERFDFDAAIVGGGPAGLAAAINLARALRFGAGLRSAAAGAVGLPAGQPQLSGVPGGGAGAGAARTGDGAGAALRGAGLRFRGGGDAAGAGWGSRWRGRAASAAGCAG